MIDKSRYQNRQEGKEEVKTLLISQGSVSLRSEMIHIMDEWVVWLEQE